MYCVICDACAYLFYMHIDLCFCYICIHRFNFCYNSAFNKRIYLVTYSNARGNLLRKIWF